MITQPSAAGRLAEALGMAVRDVAAGQLDPAVAAALAAAFGTATCVTYKLDPGHVVALMSEIDEISNPPAQ